MHCVLRSIASEQKILHCWHAVSFTSSFFDMSLSLSHFPCFGFNLFEKGLPRLSVAKSDSKAGRPVRSQILEIWPWPAMVTSAAWPRMSR